MSKIVNKRFRKTQKKINLDLEHFSSIHEPGEYRIKSSSPRYKQRKMETIGRFMKQTKTKRQSVFLTKNMFRFRRMYCIGERMEKD